MAVIYLKLTTRAHRTMLSFAAVAKEPCSISMLTSNASLVDNITADQLGGINTMLKVWKVCRTLTPANPSEAHPMMERPASQSVSEHGDPGCGGHRWSGRGPRTPSREHERRTGKSAWQRNSVLGVRIASACHLLDCGKLPQCGEPPSNNVTLPRHHRRLSNASSVKARMELDDTRE